MKTIRNGTVDKLTMRLVETGKQFVGLIFAGSIEKRRIEGDDADDVWRRLHDEAARLNPKYVGYPGARQRFLHFFPNGFHSEGFASQERDYKLAAKAKLDTGAPLEKAAMGSGFGEAVLSVFRATNMLSPFEKTRLQDVLRGSAADPFIRAAAKFTLGDTMSGLLEMERALKLHDSAKWTVATYLPFLWRPDKHMFLKPEVTKDFSARVGHGFASAYEARLDLGVYESLLDLVAEAETAIADLHPRDRIDTQSFIWVVGDYNAETEKPKL